jgi:hypothetical protein
MFFWTNRIKSNDSFRIESLFKLPTLLFFGMALLFFAVDQAQAYAPGAVEDIQKARQISLSMLIKNLSSGGIRGNLGAALMITFSMLLPTFISLIFALRQRYYLLRVLQYPALICIFLGAIVYLLQPERWFNGDWSTKFVGFGFLVGLVFSLASIFLLLRHARTQGILATGSLLIGLLIFGLRSLLSSI